MFFLRQHHQTAYGLTLPSRHLFHLILHSFMSGSTKKLLLRLSIHTLLIPPLNTLRPAILAALAISSHLMLLPGPTLCMTSYIPKGPQKDRSKMIETIYCDILVDELGVKVMSFLCNKLTCSFEPVFAVEIQRDRPFC
jgi:hypothetical protein